MKILWIRIYNEIERGREGERGKFHSYHTEILQHINKMDDHPSSFSIAVTYIRILSYLLKTLSEFYCLKISVKSFRITSDDWKIFRDFSQENLDSETLFFTAFQVDLILERNFNSKLGESMLKIKKLRLSRKPITTWSRKQ